MLTESCAGQEALFNVRRPKVSLPLLGPCPESSLFAHTTADSTNTPHSQSRQELPRAGARARANSIEPFAQDGAYTYGPLQGSWNVVVFINVHVDPKNQATQVMPPVALTN